MENNMILFEATSAMAFLPLIAEEAFSTEDGLIYIAYTSAFVTCFALNLLLFHLSLIRILVRRPPPFLASLNAPRLRCAARTLLFLVVALRERLIMHNAYTINNHPIACNGTIDMSPEFCYLLVW